LQTKWMEKWSNWEERLRWWAFCRFHSLPLASTSYFNSLCSKSSPGTQLFHSRASASPLHRSLPSTPWKAQRKGAGTCKYGRQSKNSKLSMAKPNAAKPVCFC
jgi:hypothetical protein